MEVHKSYSKNIFLDGWSLDIYGSRKRGGLGIAKDLYVNDFVEVDAGVYVTQRLKDLLKQQLKPEVSIGISGKWRI